MPKIKPSLRSTETYTESNFLRVHTAAPARGERTVTIEHLSYRAATGADRGGWRCETIVDGEPMSKDDALFIARSYAEQNGIPVIYECHNEEAA
jgi:hypothetical protein